MIAWLRRLTYRWHDRQHRDEPAASQRCRAMTSLVPPPQTRVSWTVRIETKPRTIADWKRVHDRERAS